MYKLEVSFKSGLNIRGPVTGFVEGGHTIDSEISLSYLTSEIFIELSY